MSYFGIPIRNGIGIGLRSYVGLESKTPAWTPAKIATALWLDAADSTTITLNGSTVSQWQDKSGNGRNAAQATAANQPTYQATGLNNKPALSFDGTNDSLDFPTGFLFNQSQFSVAMVQRASAQNNNALFGPSTANFAGLEMIFNSVVSSPTSVRTNGTQRFITGLWDVANVGGVSTLTASSSATSGTFNGTNITPTSGTGIAALNFNGVYSLGRYQSSLYGATTMCEFIITPNSLTTIGRQQIEGYLAWKWGGF